MDENPQRIAQLSPIKRALLGLEQLQAKLDAVERTKNEPVAVIGMSCRFPGADSPEAFWRLLRDGVDAITEVPRERWNIDQYYDPNPEAPGRIYTRHGGFLKDIDKFDSWFFRISPREAASIDPQQRLLFEVAWEAIEAAGIPAESLKGSLTGVFVGVTSNDYAQLLMQEDGASPVDAYFFTGNPLNTMTGRLSYMLGLHGPSMTIDTACSSSLVSIHQACQSLRNGESELALAGGVNLILSPNNMAAVCRTRALAPDGRCKTFDAAADGFVRSEGCGVVVLKPLSKAVADGDRVLAVIRGSAVNHDGASGGFTVPNGHAQEAVIRQALGAFEPSRIDYVEAHGTGTALGDPIEVKALAAVLGVGRAPEKKLRIGSAKTNIGHAESAAGVAGVIKVILSLLHEEIPPHLHFRNPSGLIPWSQIAIEVCAGGAAWPAGDTKRMAGVSAFGASGTNAHLVLEEAPQAAPIVDGLKRPLHALVLSAKTEPALRDLAALYQAHLSNPGAAELDDICFTAAAGRSHFKHRLGVVAASREEAARKLSGFGSDTAARNLLTGEASDADDLKIAFLFTGQGSQYAGMGRELFCTQPTFRRALERCAEIAVPLLEKPLLDVIFAEAGSELDQTNFSQPALFALEYALVELLASWGIRPGAVLGHSVGEYAAACAAGVFDVESGLKLIVERGRLMQALGEEGRMAAVFAGEAQVREAVNGFHADVSIAAINGPHSTVISGAGVAVEAVLERLAAAQVETRDLNVSRAFHSPLVEPMLDEFETAARRVRFEKPKLPLYSNLTGAPLNDAPDAGYWREHCRATVQFAGGVRGLIAAGYNAFVEVGPKPVLSGLARTCGAENSSMLFCPLLARGNDWHTLLETLLELYVRGARIDWRGFDKDYTPGRVTVPTYPFQRKSYWLEPRAALTPREGQRSEEGQTPSMVQSTEKQEQPRRERILKTIRAQVAGILRAEVAEINSHLPFLEMGADSLVMVEALRLIENEFGLKLTIRRLFEDLSTIDALAGHIDENLPTEAAASPPVPVVNSETAPATSTETLLPTPLRATQHLAATNGDAASGLERILIEQNRLVSQLLTQQAELLRGGLSQPPLTATVALHAPSTALPTTLAPSTAPTHAPGQARAPQAAAPNAEQQRAAPLMPWGNPVERRAQGLTPRQHEHLETLIARYTSRTRKSKELAQQSRGVLADSRATVGFRFSTKEMLYPIVGTHSRGSRLWDVDGNEYIDLTMGFGVHLFGHQPPFIIKAVEDELQRAVELGARSGLASEAAALIAEMTGQDRVAFCNSGTEAVMAAVRLARATTERDGIVIFNHSYHGHADGTLAAAQMFEGQSRTVPMAPGVTPGTVENVLVLEYGADEALATIRVRASELAAVMVEPVQSRNPSLQPTEFLRKLRALTEEVGIALIFDEMITGFRVHPRGSQGWFDIRADIATYGKIVGGGLPIGVIAGKAHFMDGIDGGMWNYGDHSFPAAVRTAFGGTFCQHPLALAASRAVLLKLKEEGPSLQERLNERTARLAATLNEFFESGSVPMRVTHFGSMFRFEFSANLDLFFYHMLERGIYIWEWRTCFLSTAHSDDDIATFINAVKESIADLRDGTFLPSRGAAPAAVASATLSFPLSEAQKQLWLLAQINEAGSLAYNVNTTIELRGKLDAGRLMKAVNRIVERHEALRTTISADGEQQLVSSSLHIATTPTDYSALSVEDGAAALEQWRQRESHEPFDLSNGALFRAGLIRLGEDRHVLSLTAHHIIADGTTMGLLLEEIAAIYAGESGDVQAAPVPFREHLEQVEKQSASPEMEISRSYWLQQCAGELPSLDLPTDRPPPSLRTFRGGRIRREVRAGLADKLRKTARTNGCTLYMTLLSAFNLFLHRISGQDDLIVGIPVAGRPFQESARVVGYCTHLLPLRSRYADATIDEFLKSNRRALLDALEHQDFPFAELLRSLGTRRAANATPLVSVVFNLEPVSALPSFAGVELNLLESAVRFTAFDLSVNVLDTGAELLVDCDYSEDVFDASTIERLFGVYETLLEGIASQSGARTSTLPLLPEAERRRVLHDWNDAASRVLPEIRPVHKLFEAQAQRTPGRTAVVHGHTRMSYAELNERADYLAAVLRAHEVGMETPVAVCARRTPDLLAGLLAVWKAGGAYVPLDPAYPQARLAFMLEDSATPVLLVHRELAGVLPETNARLVFLDAGGSADARAPHSVATHDDADSLAYILYTSGSTGRPKGVAVNHRSVAEMIHWARATYTDEQLAGVLAATSASFDISVFELFAPLSWGGSVILAENALELPELPAAGEVTLVNTVPSVLTELMKTASLPASVNTVNLAGERLHRQLVRRIYRHRSARHVYNLYGPTEDTVYSTFARINRDDPHPPAIGRPLSNKRTYILDGQMQPVPVGVAGELYIGGAGLARGYLNRPPLTAERFIPDPFAASPGARLYRTGDLARYMPDGQIDYLGRVDHQVKLRGFRVELGETEAVLTAHPSVDDAIVMLRENESGTAMLVAYLLCASPEDDVKDDVRAYLRERLPEHMVPSAFVLLDEFPLLPSGKADRRRLPEVTALTTYVAPGNEIESALASIWQEVLGVEKVGIRDDFFELGGNSLSATKLVARVRESLQAQLEIRTVFRHPTIAELSRYLARSRPVAFEPVPNAMPQPDYALTPAQRRFWIHDRLQDEGGGGGGGGVPSCFLLRGTLDVDALDAALRALVERHEILRTVFVTTDNEPRQKVLPQDVTPFNIERLDLGDHAEVEAGIGAEVFREAHAPMNLETGPLFRLKLIRRDAEQHLLLVTMHHIICDGWSAQVLLDELIRLYGAHADEQTSAMAPLAIQFKDYAEWLNRLLGGAEAARMKDYWLAKLGGELPELDFPIDTERFPARGFQRKVHRFRIPSDSARHLEALARRHGATLFMALLASIKTLLYRNTGQEDFIVGTPVAGRVLSELEGQIGPFLNVLALRDEVSGAERFDDLLARVRETTLDAYANQLYPFDRLLDDLKVKRTVGRNPVFDVGFTLQNHRAAQAARWSPHLEIEELPMWEVESLNAEALTHLWFLAEEHDGVIDMNLVYNGAVFVEATALRLAEELNEIIETAGRDSTVPVQGVRAGRQPGAHPVGKKLLIELNLH